MSNRQLIIVAASGFGCEAAWAALEAEQPWDVIGFLDDSPLLQNQSIMGIPVLGTVVNWTNYADTQFVVAIGSPRVRRSVVAKMEGRGRPRWATVVHRSAQMSQYVSLGQGSVVCANVSMTTNISVGEHCIVNLGCTVGHDSTLGDYCTLAPLVAMSGSVSLGDGVEIGTGASIRQGLTLARGSLLGMGGVLTKNMPQDSVWMGNPAAQRNQLTAWTGP